MVQRPVLLSGPGNLAGASGDKPPSPVMSGTPAQTQIVVASLLPEVPFSPQNIYKQGQGKGDFTTKFREGEWGSAKMRLRAQGEFLRRAQGPRCAPGALKGLSCSQQVRSQAEAGPDSRLSPDRWWVCPAAWMPGASGWQRSPTQPEASGCCAAGSGPPPPGLPCRPSPSPGPPAAS